METAADEILARRSRSGKTQQALGCEDHQRCAVGSQHLSAQQVEVLGRRGAICILQRIFGTQLQETLDPRTRVLRPLPFEAVGQKHHEAAHATPFYVGRGDELVDHYLGTIREIAELRLPERERPRFGNAVAVLEAEDRGFGELRVVAVEARLLGIEMRESLEELPIDTDWDFFFQRFDDPNICYWHDIGHAQIKENLGFIHHRLHLESMTERLAGFHLHDVQFPARDHRPPGQGMIDFEGLKHVVKPEHIKVFEISPSLNADEAREGVAHLKSIWGED